jgi:hypothetical protein
MRKNGDVQILLLNAPYLQPISGFCKACQDNPKSGIGSLPKAGQSRPVSPLHSPGPLREMAMKDREDTLKVTTRTHKLNIYNNHINSPLDFSDALPLHIQQNSKLFT